MADARGGVRYTVEPDFAARQAVISALMWAPVAATFLVVTQLLLLVPEPLGGIEFLSYGRLRAVSDTVVVFGWLSMAALAAIFALLPRISEVQLHNEVLGATAVVWWNLTIFAGIGALLLGFNQGRPLAELPILLDAGLFFLMLMVAYNAAVTATRRRPKTLYVSAWYLLAAAIVAPIVFAIGNLPALSGYVDAITNGFYTNAFELLWLLAVGLGVAYYVVPVDTGNPVHSMRLARVGFWTLMLVGGWAGHRFLIGGPVPSFLEAIGVAMTFVLLVPILTAASNLFATARGRWELIGQAYGLRFAATGLGLLVVWAVGTAVSTLPQVSRIVGLTAWGAGLRHLLWWGVISSFGFALIYRIWPLCVGRAWQSTSLQSFHFWGTMTGVGLGWFTLAASGVFQGTLAQAWARLGAEQGFDEMVQFGVMAQRWFQAGTLLAFAILAAAQYALVYNAFRTARVGPPVVVLAAPAATGIRA